MRRHSSIKAAAAQIVGDDDVGHCVEYELDVVRVGGARLVAVDLLVRRVVLRLERRLDVCGRLLVGLSPCTHAHTHTDRSIGDQGCPPTPTCVFREADRQRAALDLLGEQVLLVEKEDDARLREPFVVADRVEQFQRFLHAVLK